ncbi:MAG TPA: Stk1 family PASTA domain-containing Ser/Thr kinase [Nocardioidaceae bacterium]|nr:Stk1 family PASTA domain-containing Ser/Thr kinase [Nocardioidaceae bacterium]
MTSEPPNGNGHPPEQVGGRYELSGLLGRGGMAEVRAGHDTRLGRRVAVKRLRTDLASDPTFQARFRREAQSAASLNHPAIVAVYDTGDEEAPDGSGLRIPYIVMEYVEGRTLREILREGRKILPERAMEITAGVLAALDYSHRAGIIHRDIKPANVMLTPSGEIKVMDFGIARAIADSSATMTQTAAVVGTAQYLSPEQARGEQVDARSDIYSTGCLFYELLTGRPPFVGDSPVAVAYQHVREDAPPPSSIDPEVAPELDAIAAKSLAKPTAERYQSAAEMRADIERALAGHAISAPPVAAAGAAGDAAAAAGTAAMSPVTQDAYVPTADQDKRERRRRGWIWGLLALAVVALFVLLGLFLPQILAGEDTAQVNVPRLVDLTEAEARNRLEQENLELGEVTPQPSDTIKAGLVMTQDPEPSTVVDKGSEVDIVVSTGRREVTMHSVIGDQLPEARAEIEDQGLRVRVERTPGGERRNTVVETDPEAGEDVPVGTRVTLVVTEGPLEVPDVVGETEDVALATLDDAGFTAEVVDDPSADAPAGIVVAQSPSGESTAQPGDTVIITVSRQPVETETPEPTPSPTETETSTPTPTPSPSPTETETETPTTPSTPTTPATPTTPTTPASPPSTPETPPGQG